LAAAKKSGAPWRRGHHRRISVDQGSVGFLKRLLDTPAPSGFEAAAARVWRDEAQGFADRVMADISGNSIAVINESGSPRIMLAGHIDEIGVMVTHIDDQGYLYIEGIGGWDPQVLVGQRIRLLTRKGDVIGVVGRKPIHLIKGDEKEKAVKLSDLWVDVGAKDREAANVRGVRVGDPGVIDARLVELGDGLIASRSIDNRIGAYVVLEALRILSQDRPAAIFHIRDYGPGIPLDAADRIGKPFFTTKSGGLGLGLFLSHATLDLYAGSVRLFNQPGGGTLTEVTVPAGSGHD
jgi:hypothetical protein